MKRLLLAIALVLTVAIPALAQNGPVKIKPLMVYTHNESVTNTPWFNHGETVSVRTSCEMKGTGTIRLKTEVCNSAGILIYRRRSTPLDIDYPTFNDWTAYIALGSEVFEEAGYFTVKIVYVDVATGKTWSHQTKIHLMGL